MSWTMAVWDGPTPGSDAEARATFEALHEQWLGKGHVEQMMKALGGDRSGVAQPSASIASYVDALLARFPDLGSPGSDLSPWSDGPLIDNAAGPVMKFGFGHGLTQLGAPVAARIAAERGLVCFDPQSGGLWNDDTCLEAILRWEGQRVVEPVLSPEDLDRIDVELTEGLRPSGFERWFPGEHPEGWRVSDGPIGAVIWIGWRLIGHRGSGAQIHVGCCVRNEVIEGILLRYPFHSLPFSAGDHWTVRMPFEEAIGVPLPATVLDLDDGLRVARLICDAGDAARSFVSKCSDIDFLADPDVRYVDRHRLAVARALRGDIVGAVAPLEAAATNAAERGRRSEAEGWLRFADWIEAEIPVLSGGYQRPTSVDWSPPRQAVSKSLTPVSARRMALLDRAIGQG
jgi:hypothetical protein